MGDGVDRDRQQQAGGGHPATSGHSDCEARWWAGAAIISDLSGAVGPPVKPHDGPGAGREENQLDQDIEGRWIGNPAPG